MKIGFSLIKDNNMLRKRLEKIEFLIGGEAITKDNEIIRGFNTRLDALEAGYGSNTYDKF